MILVLTVIMTILFAAAFAVTLIHQMHMYQLNSYAADTHFNWIMKNKREFFLPFVAVIVAAVFRNAAGAVVVSLIYAFRVYRTRSRKSKAKIKLAYTGRVRRMLITCTILTVVIAGASFLGWKWGLPAITEALLWFLAPLVIILSNILNRPVERAINQRFINEARAILDDAGDLKIVGITGSFGKTSMKYYLSSLLQAEFDVLKTPGNYNTTLGVVKTIREMYSPLNQVFVCEMGARRVGEIKEICDLVHPDLAVITSIGPQHLETFKSLENVQKTKFELADSLAEGSPLFLNGDDENIMNYPHREDAIIYGIDNHQGYYADGISADDQGSQFTIHTPDGETMEFTTKLLGRHNVLNITGAIAVAHTMGIDLKELVPRVRRLAGVPHRLQFRKDARGAIIDDAYNSNPQGTRAALEVMSMFDGLKIMITPGMVELGEKQDELNFEFGKNAAAVCDFIALVGEAQTKPIYDGLISAGYPAEKIYVAGNFNQAMDKVESLKTDGRKRYILLENDLPDNY